MTGQSEAFFNKEVALETQIIRFGPQKREVVEVAYKYQHILRGEASAAGIEVKLETD